MIEINKHVPVMLKELKKFISCKEKINVIDATFGGGGYTKEFLENYNIENKSEETIENSEELNDEITLVENMKKVFLLLLGKSFEKFGPEIDKNQQVLLSLSDLAIETYISESTLKRTVKNIKRTSTIDQEYQISMSKLYIYEAAKIIEKKSRDIINSVIDDDNQENIYSSISKKLSYTKNPNIFELKTHVADKIIAENKYCF